MTMTFSAVSVVNAAAARMVMRWSVALRGFAAAWPAQRSSSYQRRVFSLLVHFFIFCVFCLFLFLFLLPLLFFVFIFVCCFYFFTWNFTISYLAIEWEKFKKWNGFCCICNECNGMKVLHSTMLGGIIKMLMPMLLLCHSFRPLLFLQIFAACGNMPVHATYVRVCACSLLFLARLRFRFVKLQIVNIKVSFFSTPSDFYLFAPSFLTAIFTALRITGCNHIIHSW